MTNNGTETVGWISGPDGRGTLSLVWTCLSTLFICIWTSWHLDYPTDDAGNLKLFLHKLKWVLFLLVFPELGTALAIGQFSRARKFAKELKSEGYTQWSRLHCLFAIMGGLRIRNKGCEVTEPAPAPQEVVERTDKCWCNNVAIHGSDLSELAGLSLLPQTPPVSTADIKKRGKADALVKSIALLQVFWLVAQIIGRAAQHLAISELEIVTLAYVFFCAVNYLCWWEKPLDATIPVYIEIAHTRDLDPYIRSSREEPTTERFGDTLELPSLPGMHEYLGFVFVSCIFVAFGGIHCLSWVSHFPSRTEQILWRASSIIMIGSYPTIAAIAVVLEYFEGKGADFHFRDWKQTVPLAVFYATPCIYMGARLYVIVEAFLSLRSAPASLYDSPDWTKFIPHFT